MLGILGIKTSPPHIRSMLPRTKRTPWSNVSQNRVMRRSVTVIRPLGRWAQEDGDNASPAAQHVAVARATESGPSWRRIGVTLHQQFFCAKLGCPVQVDRVDRLVGAQAQHFLDAAIDRGFDKVSGPVDIGLDRLARVVLAGRNLLQGGGMDHDVDAAHRPPHTFHVADIPQEVAETGMVETAGEHFVLF